MSMLINFDISSNYNSFWTMHLSPKINILNVFINFSGFSFYLEITDFPFLSFKNSFRSGIFFFTNISDNCKTGLNSVSFI